MKKQKVLVVANWKMNPETPEEAKMIFAAECRAAKKTTNVELVVCPPALYIGCLRKPTGGNISFGVQDVFWAPVGPYVGEISPVMAHNSSVRYAVIGHSERRSLGETDEVVSKKAAAAVRAGLSAIVCIGERERDAGGTYFSFLKNQLQLSLGALRPRDLSSLIIAYEPIWAVGKSFKDAMKPSDVYGTSLFIKKVLSDMFGKEYALRTPILYGGSVDFENAGPILCEGKVAGLLVGRQSLDLENFPKLLSVINEF